MGQLSPFCEYANHQQCWATTLLRAEASWKESVYVLDRNRYMVYQIP